MRVLQAMAGAAHGGAEAFFTRLAVALAGRGLDQRALVRPDPARMAALAAAGIPAETARFGGPFDLATGVRFRRAVAAWRPDVVMTWMTRATVHCPRRRFVHLARLGGHYDLGRYRRADHLVVNSKGLRAWATGKGWDESRVHHIPNFVDATPARPVDRATLATAAAAPVVLALGRLHPNKAFDVALSALAAVPRAVLWLAGEGPLGDELARLAARLGVADRVRFLGWRDDAAGLLAAADVLVCPSRHEPFGNVVLEAWAHGVPVVAARAAGPAELVTDGVDGLLADIDDASALAAALERVLGDAGLARRLSAAGRAAHEAAYTEDKVAAAYLGLFARLAG
ncbi:MAG: glycosyltransferase [Alphaproteobacteria bacterium]